MATEAPLRRSISFFQRLQRSEAKSSQCSEGRGRAGDRRTKAALIAFCSECGRRTTRSQTIWICSQIDSVRAERKRKSHSIRTDAAGSGDASAATAWCTIIAWTSKTSGCFSRTPSSNVSPFPRFQCRFHVSEMSFHRSSHQLGALHFLFLHLRLAGLSSERPRRISRFLLLHLRSKRRISHHGVQSRLRSQAMRAFLPRYHLQSLPQLRESSPTWFSASHSASFARGFPGRTHRRRAGLADTIAYRVRYAFTRPSARLDLLYLPLSKGKSGLLRPPRLHTPVPSELHSSLSLHLHSHFDRSVHSMPRPLPGGFPTQQRAERDRVDVQRLRRLAYVRNGAAV